MGYVISTTPSREKLVYWPSAAVVGVWDEGSLAWYVTGDETAYGNFGEAEELYGDLWIEFEAPSW